jgi:C4-dicarboxylate-specific signal transduction histidine kinase
MPPALCVWADESQLQMVVLNLLKNALDVLRGCPLPRKLSLQLVQEQQDVCLRVSDNGPGIALAQRQQVFQIFHSSKADGMGLGLWLSQSVAQNHGGSLSVVDSPLGGACFMLRLPVFVAN